MIIRIKAGERRYRLPMQGQAYYSIMAIEPSLIDDQVEVRLDLFVWGRCLEGVAVAGGGSVGYRVSYDATDDTIGGMHARYCGMRL
jgi:hypothetical protein